MFRKQFQGLMSHLRPKTHQIKLIRLKQNNIENQHSSDMETTSLDVLVLRGRGVYSVDWQVSVTLRTSAIPH